MKIRLAIVDRDEDYAKRLVNALTVKYPDKIEVSSFSSLETALYSLSDLNIDVLLAAPDTVVGSASIPNRIGFGYLISASGIRTYEGHPAVCKYQKTDLIYKQVLDLYVESANSVVSMEPVEGESRALLFMSPGGGAGASTVAAACALHFAGGRKKTLYFNLERFGSANPFFSAEGQFCLSDLIFALKRRNSNLSMKLESCVRQSSEGVSFFAPVRLAPERFELSDGEVKTLLETLRESGGYHSIVVDMDFTLDSEALRYWTLFDSVIWVIDDSQIAHEKTLRALELLTYGKDKRLSDKVGILYNKFNANGKTQVGFDNVRVIGTLPKLERSQSAQVAAALAGNELFDHI